MYKTCNGHVSPNHNKIQIQPNTHLWIPWVSRLGVDTTLTVTHGKGFSHPLSSSKEWSYSGKWSCRGSFHSELFIFHIQFQWMCSSFQRNRVFIFLYELKSRSDGFKGGCRFRHDEMWMIMWIMVYCQKKIHQALNNWEECCVLISETPLLTLVLYMSRR